jgi:hypothetical protein
MFNQILTLTIWSLMAVTIAAQQPLIEYGSTAELKGVTRIYIYTDADLNLRNKLAGKVAKKLPQLKVTESARDAEIILSYSQDSARALTALIATEAGSEQAVISPRYDKVEYGNGLVVTRGHEKGAVRILMSWQKTKTSGGGPLQRAVSGGDVASKFADAFIKAYINANK